MSTTEITGIQRDDTVHGETYFTAADMATAAAQGFREGQAAELAAMRAGGEPVAEMVPCYTPSGKRVAVISRFQHLPIGTKLYAHPQPAAQDAELLDWLGNQYVTVRIPLPYGSRECFIGAPDDNDGAAPSPWDIRAAIRTAIAAQQGDSHE